jgi:hypothetical protein
MSLAHHSTKANARRHKLTTVRIISMCHHNGRLYKLLDVRTQEGLLYRCLRLYNENGHFIKQFLFEPEITNWLVRALARAENW